MLLTPAQAAALVQMSVHTIYGWSSAGRLKKSKVKVGNRLRFRRDAFLKEVQRSEDKDRPSS